jgi:glycosyltransferase involved in cell wall biosynthesis
VKKLIIQIPAYNEAETLPEVLADLPRQLEGIASIQVIVIADGSTDGTAQVAMEHGADFVLRHRSNRGLSKAFISGIQFALALGADIIVNTDADHQYPGDDIARLIQPILAGDADLVIGDRQPQNNRNFSPWKRFLESLGSAIARRVSSTSVPDAVSGFRAYSRYAALPLQVYNPYSYTLETLVQAGKSGMKIAHIPIRTNPEQRESRLHRGALNFIWRQSGVIIRSYVLYQPLRTFVSIGALFLVLGLALLIRFLVLYFTVNTAGRFLQSVSIGGTLTIAGIIVIIIGFLGDSIRANRQISEEILVKLRNAAQITDLETLTEFDGHPIYSRSHPYSASSTASQIHP